MGKLLLGFVLGAVVGFVLGAFVPIWPEPWKRLGQFTGDVTATFLDDGRTMRLEKDFAYIDPDEKVWVAPAHSVIDGASIPQALWTVIGGPFEGQFRNASVVHDVACVEKKEPSTEVHRMFYFACRCGGVSETKAKAMYYAVAHFGPRWRVVYAVQSVGPKTVTTPRPVDIEEGVELGEKDAKAILRYFEQNNPALDEIPELKITDPQ